MSGDLTSNPTLTLSVGGTFFRLTPDGPSDGSVQFVHQEGTDEVLLNLRGFTGTLCVSETFSPSSSITPKTNHVSKRKMMEQHSEEASKKVREALAETDDASVATDIVAMDEEENAPTSTGIQQSASMPPITGGGSNNTSPSHHSYQEEASQDTTLLGQSQLSDNESMDDDREDEEAVGFANGTSNTLLESLSPPDSASKPARVSLGEQQQKASKKPAALTTASNKGPAPTSLLSAPATSKNQDPPCARWGHTVTDIGKDRLLVYGGQTIDKKAGPTTLEDVCIYHTLKKTWFRPFNCNGSPRQWHTATYMPDRQLLISFGGESVAKGKVTTESKVMVLDTEIMLWYPPQVTGDVPSSRSGHTATVLGNDLVVFGGVKGRKWLNTVSVLDCTVWRWTSVKAAGAAPPPRSYHTAVALGHNRIVIVGGNNSDQCFDSVHVLEKTTDEEEGTVKWRWSHPTVRGCKPVARTGHSATVLADGKTVVVYGGWDPNDDSNDEEEPTDEDDEETIFDDYLYLDTENWTWRKGGVASKRVGHAAVLKEDASEVMVFGGRVPGDEFTADFESLSIQK